MTASLTGLQAQWFLDENQCNVGKCDWWEFLYRIWEATDSPLYSLNGRRKLLCKETVKESTPLLWRHNEHDVVSNHQPYDCLLNRSFRRRSKKTSKLGVTGLCVGNSPETGKFPAQIASNAENVSIWWRHHVSLWSAWGCKSVRVLARWCPVMHICVNELAH